MKFSEKWLREWVSSEWATDHLCESFTMAGLEVDGIEPAAPAFDNIVVAEVLAVEKHPEADKLQVCTVNAGQSENLSIVCGAKNVRAGMRVPCALVGAQLPSGLKIKKAKLRGVESFGMLCSTEEIGISEAAEGLMDLPSDAPIGTSIREYLQLDDTIIDVDFTPNRGDCLSIRGMARETGVLDDKAKLTTPKTEKVVPTIDDVFGVKINASEDCPIYLGRVIKGIDPNAKTPQWMQERLRRSGLRSISPLVDVTNYVLMEMGQPMHAFDLDKLSGEIIVRRAKDKEKVKLLDESEIELDADCLVIADSKQAHAFAGVMGGLESAVTASTRNVFLECAYFNPDTIRGRARRFGMQTDSSYRFERGVDFTQQHEAMERATQLVLDIAGGQAGSIIDVTVQEKLPDRNAVALRRERVKRVLGIELQDEIVTGVLQRLGMKLESADYGWRVIPPSHRFDVVIEADLIEEIGRVYGYNRIPMLLPLGDLTIAPRPEGKVTVHRIRSLLVDRGYNEAITYSFVDPEIEKRINPDQKAKELANPISSEMSLMRTSLWSSLLKTLSHNLARQQNRVRIFEIGRRFLQQDTGLRQETVVAGVIYGGVNPKQWDGENAAADFFDGKSDVEAIFALTHEAGEFIFSSEVHPALHPGQSASIKRNGERIGWLGTLHPEVQKELDLTASTVVFEISLDALGVSGIPAFKSISKYPSIHRDLALVVDTNTAAADVINTAKKSGGDRLRSVQVFDVYQGKGVAEGKKSLAISLMIQDDTQTLTESEVEQLITGVLDSLKKTLGATLRD
ncbi:MAG: phenylalanine--tRNA ligase subunit beta [Gammaproteobacteria bacterium]|nr:phenylalanine--tRNA ligase subunit beta [Gammaproteobacteria bacterium]